MKPLTAEDLDIVGHLLPGSAHDLIKRLGVGPALALLNAWPGVQFQMPRRPDANAAGAKSGRSSPASSAKRPLRRSPPGSAATSSRCRCAAPRATSCATASSAPSSTR
ncbi:MAG: hypothetical protein M5R42_16770 [Rhodocyclaceae bacterium]|nr:hypothetical protein [Rhodocyclaceae bacterium]